MALPTLQVVRIARESTLPAVVELLSRLQDNLSAYASALTNDRAGLLSHGLTIRANFKGQVVVLTDVDAPDPWVPVTLLNGWSLYGASQFGPPAVRAYGNGKAGARGAIRKTTMPMNSEPVLAIPDGHGPTSIGDRRCLVEGLGQVPATFEVVPPMPPTWPNGYVQYASGYYGFVDLTGVEWEMAGPMPPWPVAKQRTIPLPGDFPGDVETVRVEDAVLSSGVHMGPCPVDWKVERTGSGVAVRLLRVDRLSPFLRYKLVVSILAA